MLKDLCQRKFSRMGLLPLVMLTVPVLVFAVSLTPLYGAAQNDASPKALSAHGATASGGFLLAASAPPKIKHEIADKKDCLQCHKPETGEKPSPKNHVGRKNESCMLCHKPAK